MSRRSCAALLCVGIFVSVLCSATIAAENKDELKGKLREVREKKVTMRNEYDSKERAITTTADKKIQEAKGVYRQAYNAAMTEKDQALRQTRKDYNAAIKPVLQQEKELISQLGRDATEDFARTRSERAAAKQ